MLHRVDDTRRDYSLDRLRQLGDKLDSVLPLLEGHPLCIYATGSYGRLEAWSGSDIDLFFLYDGASEDDGLPWTRFLRLTARLIEATEEMGFPPFSGDGRYLERQYIRDMERVLGSPRDDSLNAFTARMLFLLESRPLLDTRLYDTLLEKIIGFYYRDFADHADDFLPIFLINDILRFWRTLTLNYEHHRLKLLDLVGDELERKKADSALKNYKLKVSRAATCFSMVASLTAEPTPVRAATVFEACRMTPAERLQRLRSHGAKAAQIVDELDVVYDEFLASVQRDEGIVLSEFADDRYRRDALRRAARYGDLIYELLDAVASRERMRYMVI
jgi:hypothetical protein